ncbi:MAG: hypothetical protein H6Q64_390 [Firmicutes bacterium]|nr:hypothetical protein [Bacillota bacterium]
MKLSAKEYKLIVENSPNMIWRAGMDAKCNYFNQTWLKFTGRSLEQEIGDGWAEGVHAEDYNRCIQIYLDSFAKRVSFEMDYRLKRSDGIYRWINDRGVPIFDDNENFAGYIGSCMDVTEKKEGEILKDQAYIDSLCKIYNRNFLETNIRFHFEKALRNGCNLSFIMADIDDFKQVNDQFGHLAGDKVLVQVASILKESVRDIDICGRYGGEEFVVIAVNSDLDQAFQIAERIRKSIASSTIYVDTENTMAIPITVSCGVSSIQGCNSLEEMINRMDQGLYLAKRSSKNCVKYV